MRRFKFIPPAFLLTGVLGAFLRRAELRTVFDPVSGLARRGAAVSAALMALTVLALAGALALALTLGRKFEAPGSYEAAFSGNGAARWGLTALGAVPAVSAGLLMRATADGNAFLNLAGMARTAFLLLLVLSGAGMIFAAWAKRGSLLLQMASVMPALLCCYWMVAVYRVNAGNPVLLEFMYSCLALAAGALGIFYGAGYAFGRKNLTSALWLSLMAVFLFPAAAMDPAPLALRLTMGALSVYTALQMMCLLSNLELKREDAEDGEEENKDTEEKE